jgi:hypothetical protein
MGTHAPPLREAASRSMGLPGAARQIRGILVAPCRCTNTSAEFARLGSRRGAPCRRPTRPSAAPTVIPTPRGCSRCSLRSAGRPYQHLSCQSAAAGPGAAAPSKRHSRRLPSHKRAGGDQWGCHLTIGSGNQLMALRSCRRFRGGTGRRVQHWIWRSRAVRRSAGSHGSAEAVVVPRRLSVSCQGS